jgi:hypothetical protein
MIFIETPIFTKRIKAILNDDEYRRLQNSLAINPKQGVLLKNSGGIRKVRWRSENTGKSGGVRVLYYYAEGLKQLRMLFVFSKNEQDNLSDEQLSQLREIVDRWSQ